MAQMIREAIQMERTLDDAANDYKQAFAEYAAAWAHFKDAEVIVGAAGVALTKAEDKLRDARNALINAAQKGAKTGAE
jgi:major membrane immunogen (membrane-anchored lipoprotein)